ncbi:unnamed protein product [Peronospora belbahrii]|uniref:Uncharacterized protein n=1 Tax=Peronospora belbahrii TaxID=622444 RepID=A0AAU9L6G1_9STRA|nr:unnamed protein product [Peronospora belbahrii]
MPMPIPSDAGLGSKENDARLNERIFKARSELSELHKIISKDDRKFCESNGPATRTRSRTVSTTQHDAKRDTLLERPTLLDVDYHTSQALNGSLSGRMDHIIRTEDTTRSDRMRLAELSDEQLKWPVTEKETAAPRSNRARISPIDRVRATTTFRRTTAKDLRDYSTDFVQQALNFDNVTDDDDGGAPSISESMMRHDEDINQELGQEHAGGTGEAWTHEDLRTYVRQMEETIAQLVQQKDELLRNQAEFDKQASGIFPSLENLNHQLSQIVQGKLLQSGQSHNPDDVTTLHDDMLDELRIQREQLSQLEADNKRRKYDAELQEQDRAIEISRIKADVISVVANGKMRDERTELISDTVKKLQQELQEAVKNMVQRYQLLDKRINQLQTPIAQPRLVGRKTQRDKLMVIVAILSGIISVAVSFLIMNGGHCGVVERCHPLI